MNSNRSIIIDMIATFIAKRILPETRPVFSDMTDLELLSLVSWAEKSDAKRIYDLAFNQVFTERQIKDAKPHYDMWVTAENHQLPTAVRTEWIRAFRINIASGRMDALRVAAWVRHQVRRIMWIGFGLLFLLLIT